MTTKTIAILGAGGRGQGFAQMFTESYPKAKVVGVAEPREEYRKHMVEKYNLCPDKTFTDWREFVAKPKMCDAVYIATLDRDHVGPAVACMKLGYDVLLEKPMAVTLEDCQLIEKTQRETKCIFGVCHSLRYQKGFRTARDLLASGAIGRVISLDLLEQVAWWHQAHSFVRGNWGNSDRSTFMLMAKSCHDIDYIHYLVGKKCLKVSSFGALTYFTKENAPAGSAERCIDCATERGCAYSAVKNYVDTNREGWPASVCSLDHSREAHLEAIRTGPYGRCIWKCDNDVVDHQTVNMLFEDQITATFTMTAFTQGGGRKLRVHGTLGDLEFNEASITVRTYADNNTSTIQLGHERGGHGGGDQRIADEWVDALFSRDDSRIVANAQESLKTHRVVFAAEKSRREGRMIDMAAE
jgi:predicted dehydrogenase